MTYRSSLAVLVAVIVAASAATGCTGAKQNPPASSAAPVTAAAPLTPSRSSALTTSARSAAPTPPSSSPPVKPSASVPLRVDLIARVSAGHPFDAANVDGDEDVQLTSFRSESGNIACSILRFGHGSVACTVYEHDPWMAAPSCKTSATTTSLSGLGARIRACKAAIPAAVGASAQVLAYGDTAHGGDFSCLDASAGLTCVNLSTGAGFVVNRKAFTTFGPDRAPPRGCRAESLDRLAVAGLKPGHFKATRIRQTAAGPLWTAYDARVTDTQFSDSPTVIAYCTRAGWQIIDYGTSGVGCSALTPAQLSDLHLDCSLAPVEPYRNSTDAAARVIADACTTWAYAGTLSAAAGSADYDFAAGQATDAALADRTWRKAAEAMRFVASLPLTSNTQADVSRAQVALKSIKVRCGALGVDVG